MRQMPLSGKVIQEAAIELGRARKYMVLHITSVKDARGYHRTPVSGDGKGFPDLLFVGRKVVAVEVKGDGDKLKPEQEVWLEQFEQAGVETLLLTSKAYRAGALEELLDR